MMKMKKSLLDYLLITLLSAYFALANTFNAYEAFPVLIFLIVFHILLLF